MKRIGTAGALFAILATLGFLLPQRTARGQVLSPGPLSRAHAEVDGDGSCSRCHESGRRVSTNGCLDCHEDLRARIRAHKGLHGTEYRRRPCGQCHVEHIGRRATLVRWPGGSRERFDHGLTGWPLRGAHRQQECRECHDRRNSRGHRTFLGAPARCAGCHEDPHSGRFGNRCNDCHDERAWNHVDLDEFDHGRTRFPLRGAHREVRCAGCHHEPPQWRGLSFGNCTSCHDDPHRGSFGSSCTSCHNERAWSDIDTTTARANHPGLSLRGGHRRVGCADCHDAGLSAPPSRGSRCVSCHRNPHEAPFGNNCIRCHRAIRWTGLPRRIGLAAHDRTPFPLVGAHVETECRGCHRPELPRRQRYRGLEFDRCGNCHEDPHTQWDHFSDADCASCHDPHGFRPTSFGIEQHAQTSFPLDGRHLAVPCAGCHGAEHPRLSFAVDSRRCADCHDNPHGDQFAAEMQAGGCESCHRTAGWDQPNISHDTWPLTGAHAEARCVACHSPSEEDRRAGRGASYRGVPRECSGCHDDVHAGQFRLSDPVRPCGTCHATTSFETDAGPFDHASTANYPLEGHHAELPCGACHRPERLRNGQRTIRWRLGYRECNDCHADPHGETEGRETMRRRRRSRSGMRGGRR